VQQKQPKPFRRFLGTRIGRVVLIAVTILVVFGSYVYVEALLAIPVFLLFGLALPIWAGIKRPRFLALSGLVVVLIVAPLSTLVITQDVRTPVPLASSLTDLPGTGGNALLQNAGVSPYTGTTSTTFTWTVTVYPKYLPTGNTTLVNLSLYISTCPGATSPSPPSWCSAGYPFIQLNRNFALPPNSTSPIVVSFNHTLNSNGIWDWQMGVYTKNTTGKLFFQTLVGDSTYNGIEGPVVGDFGTTYFELLGTIYLDDALFLGGPFFVILLLYALFKNRERRRNEARRRTAGPVPPTGGPSEGAQPLPPPSTQPATTGRAAPPSALEKTCPNCNAVVYANETRCWKCGADLTGSTGAPLPSSSKPP
jgi:hypothetical protein